MSARLLLSPPLVGAAAGEPTLTPGTLPAGLREVLQPHVQPAGPHAPARGQQALQVSLLLQQVQPEGQPEPAHEGQARGDGHQPGQPRWVRAVAGPWRCLSRTGHCGLPCCGSPLFALGAGPCCGSSGERLSVSSGPVARGLSLACSCQHRVVTRAAPHTSPPSSRRAHGKVPSRSWSELRKLGTNTNKLC